jgi:hypothetical protein
MKYKNIIKLRLPEIQLLAVVPTQLKFSIVTEHDEPTILLFETLFYYLSEFFLRLGNNKTWSSPRVNSRALAFYKKHK